MLNKGRTRDHLVWLTTTAALSLIFLFVAATNLSNFFPVSADDGWIMSASYKLASEGVFGSDMYAGFFNAENHYFIALPVYHFIQAAVFRLLDFGVFQARLPNLLSAVLLIWVTSSLAYRYYGRNTALLTAGLIVFWRSNLTATEPRVPLLAYAHNGRYDVVATALVWLGVWLLDTLLRRPRPLIALGLGITSGLATLTQFFGGFLLLPVGIAFWQRWRRDLFRQGSTYLFAAGFLVVTLPYLAYMLVYADDFAGQSTLKGERTHFFAPGFYVENLLAEPKRFGPVMEWQRDFLSGLSGSFRPFGPWLLTITVGAAVLCLAWSLRKRRDAPWPVPWLSLLSFVLCLALFEQTKAPVYAVLLLPGVCLALAVMSMAAIQHLWQMERPKTFRLAVTVPLVMLLAVVLLEGANSHRKIMILAWETSSYETVAEQMEAALAPGAAVLGSERWWPALKEHPYLALHNLWHQWRLAEEDGRSPDFSEQVKEIPADFIIVNNNARGDLEAGPIRLLNQFEAFLATCSTLAADWNVESYGQIQIYRLVDNSNC